MLGRGRLLVGSRTLDHTALYERRAGRDPTLKKVHDALEACVSRSSVRRICLSHETTEVCTFKYLARRIVPGKRDGTFYQS